MQAVGIIAIGIAAGTLENALTQQIHQAVVDVGWVTSILDGRGQKLDQPGLAIHTPEQQGAKTTEHHVTVEVSHRSKWGRLCHRRNRSIFV